MKVTEYRFVGRGKLIGVVTLELPSGMELVDCSYAESNNGKFVGLPTERFTARDGNTAYKNKVRIKDPARLAAFQREAMAAIKEYLGTHPPPVITENKESNLTADGDSLFSDNTESIF